MNNIVGRSTPEFKQKVIDKLNEWFGSPDKYEILFQWHDNNDAHIVVKTEGPAAGPEWVHILYFMRLFQMNGIMEISQDRMVEL